jgi:hypothetical protein
VNFGVIVVDSFRPFHVFLIPLAQKNINVQNIATCPRLLLSIGIAEADIMLPVAYVISRCTKHLDSALSRHILQESVHSVVVCHGIADFFLLLFLLFIFIVCRASATGLSERAPISLARVGPPGQGSRRVLVVHRRA